MVMKYEGGGERAGGGGGGRRSYVKVAREGDLEEVAELPTNESGLLHLSTVKVCHCNLPSRTILSSPFRDPTNFSSENLTPHFILF